MSEFDKLEAALKGDRAPPRPGARQAALNAALQAYDAVPAGQRAKKVLQGTGPSSRLRIAARAAIETMTGRRPMRMTHALAGGASLAVLMIAVVTVANLEAIKGFTASDEGEAARLDASETAKLAANEKVRLPPALLKEPDLAMPEEAETQVTAATPPQPSPVRQFDLAADAMGNLSAAPPAQNRIASADPDAAAAVAAAESARLKGYRDQGRDRFQPIETNPLKVTAEDPVSTFSVDVDTSSYAFMRAAINDGVLPPDDAVRVEELINYFPYDYPGSENADEPFRATATIMQTPWNADTKLLNIGIKGFDIASSERPRANLVFLIDTSGSMQEPKKLPLLINSLRLLVGELAPEDTVAIVTYAGSAGTLLEPTPASQAAKIIAALDTLSAGGSTAGAEGIRQAYQLARQSFDADGVNRVILATDGDFNVGITHTDELQGFVEREREIGIYLSVLGFGRGNYNDALMQALAQNGNGVAAYIDTLNEARKVLVEEATSALFPIAEDVKIQVEFNPATVSEYRLIGYENRLLNREDFNNDRVDAGEIGSGHTVTALYELTPTGSAAEMVDDLRYRSSAAPAANATIDEYAFLRIRYKLPGEDTSRLIETPISNTNEVTDADTAVPAREARFASAVAGFGQLLRGGRYTGSFDYDDVAALAAANKGEDVFGYRAEFVNLVRLAKSAASMQRLKQ